MTTPDPRRGPYTSKVGSESAPLSFGQERLWVLDRLDPGSTAYTISPVYRVIGPLDVGALTRALSEVVHRHAVLRTRVTVGPDGHPRQVTAPAKPVPIPLTDLRSRSEKTRTTEARALAEAMVAEPFDLARGPLLRTALLRTSDKEHLWVIVVHHLVCDGWSLRVLWHELGAFYAAFRTGARPGLPELNLQYADFAREQRSRLMGPVLDRGLAYWRSQLAKVPPLELPGDRLRPPVRSSRGARTELALPPELVAGVQGIARGHRVTEFTVFLAAYQLLLARYCDQPDVAVGCPVAGRSRPDVEPLIGNFVNTLVLRTDLSGNLTGQGLLQRTRHVVLDALDHQEVPFEKLVAELEPARNLGRNPLFSVILAVDGAPAEPRLMGLDVKQVQLARHTAQVDLTVALSKRAADGGMAGSVEYSTDLLDRQTAEQLGRHFRQTLSELVRDPGQRIDRLPLLSTEERSRLRGWSTGPPPRSTEPMLVPEAIAAQAAADPDAPALVHHGRTTSYAALDGAVDDLADRLVRWGLNPEDRVGLLADRSPSAVAGLLAVLRAGGVAVPFSADQPAVRTARMLADAEARLMLTPAGHPAGPELPLPVLPVDLDGPLSADGTGSRGTGSSTNSRPAGLDALAVVLFTSGSSGRPKGVGLPHRALAGFAAEVGRAYRLGPGDRVAGWWSTGADGFLQEVLLPLNRGAALILDDAAAGTAAEFVDRCRRHGVTVAFLPTAYWREVSTGLAGRRLPGPLRLVGFGGEPARVGDLRSWQEAGSDGLRLVNEYGPTEATVFATALEVPPAGKWSEQATGGAPDPAVPIGTPIGGAVARVLDAELVETPVGVPGELYLGGPWLARGYLGRPAETAERFVADPAGGGARLYRTGDRARWRRDGMLEFLGRTDEQVKIQGFRVEPSEVEQVLAGHPAVRQAVVVATPGSGGDRLLAWTRPDPARVRPNPADLADYLAAELPDYMVPAAISVVDQLPLLPNGKVDRQALRATARRPVARPVTDGRTESLRHLLAELWTEILAVDHVGPADDFFALGGNSLHAVRLANRLAVRLGADVPVTAILRHRTLADLAEALMDHQPAEASTLAGPDRPGVPSRSRAPAALSQPENRPPEPLRLERRPLFALVEAGELASVDAASISCVPESLLLRRGLSAERYIEDWCQGVPMISGIKETAVGRIAMVMVPFLERHAYEDQQRLVDAVVPGLRIAARVGARVVSLINLLASATDYGRALRRTVADDPDVPQVTTGHAMTAAAVVLNLRRVLGEAGRDLARERLAFLGLGSIGLSTLRLCLAEQPHPAQLVLCDLYSEGDRLRRIAEEVRDVAGYIGQVQLAEAVGGVVPDAVYEAGVVVAATTAPHTLDADRLRPGCIVVDDSVPHAYDPKVALRRFDTEGDVLCVEGGELHAPHPMTEVRYVPRWVHDYADEAEIRGWYERDPHKLGGCVLSAAVAARWPNAPVTLGPPDLVDTRRSLELLGQLGITAVNPQCDGVVLAPERVAGFRRRFRGD